MKSKNRICKALLSLLFALLMVMTAVPALAADASDLDLSQKGSVSLTLKCDGEAVKGAKFTLYKIADVDKVGGNLLFTMTPKAAGFGKTATQLKRTDAKAFYKYAKNNGMTGQVLKTNKNGRLKFNSVECGMYLVAQTGKVDGFANCKPFFVTVPYKNGESWSFDVNATPKASTYKTSDISVILVPPEDDPPEEIVVELYKDGVLIDTIILTPDENWTFTWEDMPADGEYTVVVKGYDVTYDLTTDTFILQKEKEKEPELIKTGQNKTTVWLLACLGVTSLAVGAVMLTKGKKESFE